MNSNKTVEEEINYLFEALISADSQKRSEILKRILALNNSDAIAHLQKYLKSSNYLTQYAAKTAIQNITLKNHNGSDSKEIAPKNNLSGLTEEKKSKINLSKYFNSENFYNSKSQIIFIAALFLMAIQFLSLFFYNDNKNLSKIDMLENHKIEISKKLNLETNEIQTAKLNQISEINGSYFVKLQGTIIDIDNKKKEAVLVISQNRDKCLIKFETAIVFKVGNKIEVTGEIIRNDNLSVPVVKSQNVKVL